ncbi:MAG: carbon-nitrogen hydrolase family protein [Verrucomicrobia bacterium]|nr:carbon-nitrogen hydrolase family protein [Cytophagales bacterium]
MAESAIGIAMAQIICLNGDRAGNRLRIENAIIQAKMAGASLITFPESCLLGWINPEAHQEAFPIPGEDSAFIAALAGKYDVFISLGIDEKEGDKLYGSALLVDNSGNIMLKHRKINVLPHLMNPPYTAGNKIATVETAFGRIGLMICADTFEDNLLAEMKAQKPDLLLVPYGWAAETKEWPAHGKKLVEVVEKVAKTLHCPVIGTNAIGQITDGSWKGRIYGGQSVACDENGKVLKIGKDREPEVSIVPIELKKKI